MSNCKDQVLALISKKTNANTSSRVSFIIEYELKIVSFISALKSYKSDSLLRPFPSNFLDADNRKSFDKLVKIVEEIPSISDINLSTKLSLDCWQLLHWILTYNSIRLQLLKEQEVQELYTNLKLNNESTSKLLPNYVFKLNSLSARTRFNKLKEEFGLISLYHGTKFENIHSIIHNGLINNLNKRDAFGSGTYLANLDVAITFSPFSYIESNCSFKRLSCVLLCDVVRHPSLVVEGNDSYYLAKDDDFVNVTYLFVYGHWMKNTKKDHYFRIEFLLFILAIVALIYAISPSDLRKYLRNSRY